MSFSSRKALSAFVGREIQVVRKLIHESHSQLVKRWCFGIVGLVGRHPEASAFDEFGILSAWTSKPNPSFFKQIASLTGLCHRTFTTLVAASSFFLTGRWLVQFSSPQTHHSFKSGEMNSCDRAKSSCLTRSVPHIWANWMVKSWCKNSKSSWMRWNQIQRFHDI